MLTPTQKTQLGVGLIEEAIMEALTQQGVASSQSQIQQNLGIGSGGQDGNMLASILNQLVQQNVLTQSGQGNQAKFQIGNQQRGAATANR
jgi:hypothetical protein